MSGDAAPALIFSAGCSPAATDGAQVGDVARDEGGPRHLAVVCEGDGGCSAAERAGAFDAWAKDAVYRPGSTFELWSAVPAGKKVPDYRPYPWLQC